jgi:hypothetical protein
MSSRQFKIFWEELLWGDGNGDKRRKPQLTGANKAFLSGLQATAILAGFSTNATWAHHENNNDSWLLGIANKKYIEIKVNNKLRKNPAITKSEINTDCRVWCIQNKNETLVVRRNGSVAIIGNCVIMARPTMSLTVYFQSIGRGTRLKSKEFIEAHGVNNCVIIDIVDNYKNHELVNSFNLDRIRPAKEKIFVNKEEREKIADEERKREAKLLATSKEDKKINLFKLPIVKVCNSPKMLEEATPKQIEFIRKLGVFQDGVEYTKAMASELITMARAEPWMERKLRGMGYDVSGGATIGQYYDVIRKDQEKTLRENKYRMDAQ